MRLKSIAAAFAFAAVLAGMRPRRLLGQQLDVRVPLIARAERKPAPPFRLGAAHGKTVELSGLRGKVVLVNFWAARCGGCVLEIPSFIQLQRAYGNGDFTAVGIAADIAYEGLKGPDEAWALVRPFMKAKGVNYPIVMGDNAVINTSALRPTPRPI